MKPLVVFLVLPLLVGCSASDFRDWAAGVQLQASTDLYQSKADREMNAWQMAGESGTIRNPRAEAEAAEAKAAAKAAQPDASATAPPAPPPLIYFTQ